MNPLVHSFEKRDFFQGSAGQGLAHLVALWEQHLRYEKNASPHTVTNYQQDLKNFFLFLQNHKEISALERVHLETLTSQDVRSFLAHRLRCGVGASSNARNLSALKAFFFVPHGFPGPLNCPKESRAARTRAWEDDGANAPPL